jgi:hypothetical protein
VLDLILFGLDDALALTTHRAHLLQDRAAYEAQCFGDAPNDRIMGAYYDHFVASRDMWVICSRSEAVREQTEDWLFMHGIYYAHLLLRPAADERASADLYLRWLHDGTIPRERVLCAYDSDPAVISMYRAEGIQCFHVLGNDV